MIKKIFLVILFALVKFIYSQGYICAVGGGSENYNDWSDEPYRWIVQKADSGKIIILSYSDATNWLPNYFMSLGADTAYNKTISSITIANHQSTFDELITAKAIFLRGGDQWQYIRLWKGTKTEEAIKYVFQNGGVIAGTSAGAMVLGEFDFSAQNGSAYPDEALLNPFYSRMRFENNFLNLMQNVLFDTHLMERGRHGRTIAMVYNIYHTYGKNIFGVGIDDRTAICISPDRRGAVMGSGSVSIFYSDENTRFTNYVSGKYTIENLKCHLLTRGWEFDFENKTISYIPPSAKSMDTLRNLQFPLTNFYLTGNNDINSNLSNNLSTFLSNYNSTNVLIITHPGFSNSQLIINYLESNNYNYSVINLTSSTLNDFNEAIKISHATCILIAGDSLSRLSLLNESGKILCDSFYSKIQQGTSVFFFGNAGKVAGEFYVDNVDFDNYASYRGRMTNNSGLNIFSDLIFQPMLYEDSNFYENRMSALLWGLMRNRKKIGLYLNGLDRLSISSENLSISGNVNIPFIIVDLRETKFVDSSTYRATNSFGPRQVVAFDNFRISLTNHSQVNYSLTTGKFDNLTSAKNEKDNSQIDKLILYQNYPNPFNHETTIRFKIHNHLKEKQKISIKIFDILGREKKILLNDYLEHGEYIVKLNANDLSSGIYFYQIIYGEISKARAMMLIK